MQEECDTLGLGSPKAAAVVELLVPPLNLVPVLPLRNV